jgi:hypothetical protein
MTLKKYVKVFKSLKPANKLYRHYLEIFFDSNQAEEYKPTNVLSFKDIGNRRIYKNERYGIHTVTYWKPSRRVQEQKLYNFEIYKESAVEVRKFFKDNHQDYIAVIKSIKPTGKTIGRQKQYKIIYTLKSKKA